MIIFARSIPFAFLFLLQMPVLQAQVSVSPGSPLEFNLAASSDAQTIEVDLREHFSATGEPEGTLVQFNSNLGVFHLEMLDSVAPGTVQNFLAYVNEGRFSTSVIHRAIDDFIIQGGGYKMIGDHDTPEIEPIETEGPIQNEFNPQHSNLRGTVSMAKLPGDPHSATSQWFVNLGDNSENLDAQNGGFTVFARVIGEGMSTVDAIAGVPVFNVGPGLESFPLKGFDPNANVLTADMLVSFPEVQVIDFFPAPNLPGFVAFHPVFNGPVQGALNGSILALIIPPGISGSATVSIHASESGFSESMGEPLKIRVFPSAGLSGAVDLGQNWSYSTWLGLFYQSPTQWIHHPTLGWLYPAETAVQGGIHLFAPGIGWLWTRRDVYPHFWWYHADGGNGDWLTYARDTSQPRWFYDWSIADWRSFEP